MKILIVSENASARMSGETFLPLYYFRKLAERGATPYLITHARCREELRETLSDAEYGRVRFVEEHWTQRALWQVAQASPERIRGLVLDQGIHLVSQLEARRLARRWIGEEGIELVFEPAPITPKGVSCMYGLGVPVVVGPLCGGMELPEAFRYMDGPAARVSVRMGRALSRWVHAMYPGKLEADAILVGNTRTIGALPAGCRGRIYHLPESGVDLSKWAEQPEPQAAAHDGPTRFVYLARFVDWKGVEFLVEAFARVARRVPAELDLIGDGELFEATRRQVALLGLEPVVRMHGRLPLPEAHAIVRASHVYMAPGLRECGGCALLEAMAMAKPIVAANWGGPAEFLEGGCALLVDPSSRESFVEGLADAMVRLAKSPELRETLGRAAQERVRTHAFDWDTKVDRLLEIFEETLERRRSAGLRESRAPRQSQGAATANGLAPSE
jgi:glycosyltransferase involved in cell wall biosynthesis